MTATIDRAPQHIPLAIGGLPVAHRPPGRRPWWERPWRRRHAIACAAGVAAAAAGAVLSLTRPPVAVFAVGDTVRVGSSVLTPAPGRPGEYRGDAALVMVRRPDGTIRAAASTVAGGVAGSAACVMSPPSGATLEERCQFHDGTRRLASVDRFTIGGGLWLRRYDDGEEVRIAVPSEGAVVPVPFAIGRR